MNPNNFWTGCLVAILLLTPTYCNLLSNPDFEEPQLGEWFPIGTGLDFRTTSNAISGQMSLLTGNRDASWNGPGQMVDIKVSTNYRARCYVKLLNDKAEKLFQQALITVSLDRPSAQNTYLNAARQSFLSSSKGWVKLEGTFRTPTTAFSSATFYVQGPDPGVSFLVDDMSLTEMGPAWREEADARIEKYRKSDVSLNIHLPPGLDTGAYEIEVRHVKHSFPFGTVVNDFHLLRSQFQPYRDLLFGMFNWFTVASYKWTMSQGDAFNLNYTRAIQATKFLRGKGFPVRAHTMFYGVENNVPGAVKKLSKSAFNSTVFNRIQYMTGITRGKIEHWDVNNELLHGSYFEDKTRDPDFTKKLFSWIHQADPDVKLFLNDYDVLASGSLTQAYYDQALEYKRANVNVYGLGLQGHLADNVEPDPVLLKLRLDLLAETGLPLWVTELDLVTENVTLRADWYETVWRLLYSHPAVEGIIMWGFWSENHWRRGAELVSGVNFYINEAGKRFLQLTQAEWSTHLTHPVAMGTEKSFRGFHGDYDVIVRKAGQIVKQQRFSLGKAAMKVDVVIEGNEQPTVAFARPSLAPYVNTSHTHEVFTARNQRTDGQVTSGQSATLQCVNRLSPTSAIGDDEKAVVSCEAGEVMTSCSMLTEDKSWIRDGEKYEFHSGQVRCVGINSYRATAGVRSQARCCKLTGLSCVYRISGPPPSPLQDGDQAETTCAVGHFATGCLSSTYYMGASDGSFHRTSSCVSQVNGFAEDIKEVFSSAICCWAPQLQCRIIQSEEGARTRGSKVTSQPCADSEVMLGCSVYSEDGRTAGAKITDGIRSLCEGVNGIDRYQGERGVSVTAVCCRRTAGLQ